MSSNIICPFPNKSVSPNEKVAPSDEVEKISGTLDDIEEPVVTIRWKDLDNKIEKDNTKKYQLQGKSTRSTRCFDIDHDRLEENVCTREPYFYKQIYKINTEGQEMETCKKFVVPMVYTKIT